MGQLAEARMVLLTMIARVADGLPLAASMQEDEQVGGSLGLIRPGPIQPISLSFRLWLGLAAPCDRPFIEPLGRGWGVFAG